MPASGKVNGSSRGRRRCRCTAATANWSGSSTTTTRTASILTRTWSTWSRSCSRRSGDASQGLPGGNPMTVFSWRFVAAVAAVLALCGGRALAQEKPAPDKAPAKEAASFGTLETMTADAAKAKLLEWLKEVGKADVNTTKEFEAIWSAEKPMLDKVADTFSLGDPEAKKLLDEARDPNLPPPTQVPAVLKDAKKPMFFRANLALAYAKALSNRRVQEEALEALKPFKPEQVIDPSAFLFTRAVAEYSLLKKEDCGRSILRLLDDVADAPERYKTVGALMALDMQTWR